MRLDGRKNFQSVKLLRQISYSELLPTNCLSVFDYFVGLVIKLLKTVFWLDSVKQTFSSPPPSLTSSYQLPVFKIRYFGRSVADCFENL